MSNIRDHVLDWFDALYHIDVINDAASFAFSNPTYTFPEIRRKIGVSVQNLGHPLIKTSHRITNDLNLDGEGQLALITGSNMSGKSTFLRTIGVNLVLAHIGGSSLCGSI